MVDVTLADGRRLTGERVRVVVNRLVAVPMAYLATALDAERAYVEQEWRALLCSALFALPAVVIERPLPFALTGRWRSPAEWLLLAAEAGLPTVRWRWEDEDPPQAPTGKASGRRAALVIGGVTVGPGRIDERTARGCERLAKLAGVSLLQVDLVGTGAGAACAGVTAPADMRLGGQPGLDALATLLR